jgi:ATP-binding cassette subfamily C protein
MRVFLYFARAYPWQSLIVLVCLLLTAVMETLGLGAVLPVLNAAIQSGEVARPPSGFEATVLGVLGRLGVPRELLPLVLVMIGAFGVKALLLLVAKQRVGYTVAHVATDLRLRLLRALLGTSWSYYTRQPVGLAANAMATEASRGAHSYYYLSLIFTYAIQAVIALSLALAVSWQVTLVSSAAALVSIATLNAFVRMSSRAGRRQTELLKSLLGRLTDVLQAVKFLKATAREPLVGPLLEDDTRRLKKALRKQVLSKEALQALQEPILVIFCGLGLIVGRLALGMPASEVGFLILLFARTLSSINKTQRKYQQMVTVDSALWSLQDMIDAAEREREHSEGTREPDLKHGLTLNDVGIEYDGRSVLEDVSIEIPVGGVTAIVGASGTGKTTLVDLITGLCVPQRGVVAIDGVPLPELDLRRWREMIGYVPQETLLLNDSVRRNVTLGDPSLGDAEVERVLRDAGAWEYVCQLPGQLDASVGERGALLSGGQRQRIAIARALAHGPSLLLLDEATAALDPENEAAVWSTVAKLRGKTTVVAISHQPALVGLADRIYRIENGAARRVSASESPTASAEAVA